MHRIVIILLVALCCYAALIPKKESPKTLIGVLGCIREKQPIPAFSHYLESKPDLCLWIGDNVYGDTKTIGLPALKESYKTMGANEGFRSLTSKFPYMATWDDHDFGKNDGGNSYPLKERSKQEFIKFWGLEKEIAASQEGIYYAKTFKDKGHTYQVIMLDVRYNRDSIGSNGQVLGESQWKWLEQSLAEKSEIRFIVSGFQLLLDKESGSETWDNFPKERDRLFNLVKASGAKGVIFLTGDQHYGEVCRQPSAIGYDAVELQFCGLNQTESPEFNTSRVSTVSRSLNSSAYIEIHWESSEYDMPHVLFNLFDTDSGIRELSYRVNFSELGY